MITSISIYQREREERNVVDAATRMKYNVFKSHEDFSMIIARIMVDGGVAHIMGLNKLPDET